MTVATKTRPIAAYAEQRAAADGEFTRRFVATTPGVKRDGLDIDLEGMSTENFMRNPVFLYVHDYFGERLPIGLVKTIRVLKSKMIVTVLFDKDDEFAVEVLRKFDNGFMSAVSIGWETLEFDRDTMRVLESDLLDVSAVPVPGDPDALMIRQRSMLRALGQDLLDKFPEETDTGGSAGNRIEPSLCGTNECDHQEGIRKFLETSIDEHLFARDTGFDETIRCTVCGTALEPEDNAMSVPDPDGGRFNIITCVDCGDKISGESKETIDTQEGEHMAMERMERVIAALDEVRDALSALMDGAGTDDNDESMGALLAAFNPENKNDEGEEG
ncbi:hypothetical protein LCGC14_2297670 [marine sediment metagenome]|uniref:Uncharacterized protein n=1 Tax=marine sediment metagenome TaxID=412755 RepID=A0A0F9CPV3_9ZZZZ